MKTKDYTPTCCDEKSVRNEVLGKSFYYCRVCKFETTDFSYAAEERRRELKKEREQEPLQRYGYRPQPVKASKEKAEEPEHFLNMTVSPWRLAKEEENKEAEPDVAYISPSGKRFYWNIGDAKPLPFDEDLEGDAAKTHWYMHWKEYE